MYYLIIYMNWSELMAMHFMKQVLQSRTQNHISKIICKVVHDFCGRHQFITNGPDEKWIWKANYTFFEMRKSRNLYYWHQSRCWQWVYHLHVASHEAINMICFISANSAEKIRATNLILWYPFCILNIHCNYLLSLDKMSP